MSIANAFMRLLECVELEAHKSGLQVLADPSSFSDAELRAMQETLGVSAEVRVKGWFLCGCLDGVPDRML